MFQDRASEELFERELRPIVFKEVMSMPTTILDGESHEDARRRRFREEAAIDAKINAHRVSVTSDCPECGSADTTHVHHDGGMIAPECDYYACNCCNAQWGHE